MILNLSSKMGFVQRSSGQSALAGSAYNSRENLYDERLGESFDYRRKKDDDVVSLILAPENSPKWVFDRQALWNKAEASEKRLNSQIAQRMMFSLPNEFSREECLEVIKSFCGENFVSKGQVVDVSLHDEPQNKHFHFQTTLRPLEGDGFHPKKPREWTKRSNAQKYRESLASICNEKLKELNLEKRVEHLSFEAQGIERTPTIHLGKTLYAQMRNNQKSYERMEEYRAIIDESFENALVDPETCFFKELHQKYYVFTEDQMLQQAAVISRSPQDAVEHLEFLKRHPTLISIGKDSKDRPIYALLSEIEKEQGFFNKADELVENTNNKVNISRQKIDFLSKKHTLSAGQERALISVLGAGHMKLLNGYAGVGKTTAILAIKEALEASGWKVEGAAPINLAVDSMNKAGLSSRTLNRLMDDVIKGERLSSKTVLIVDEASLIDDTKLTALMEMAASMKFKLVLMGDMEQLPSVSKKNDWVRALFDKYPSTLLDEVRRHNGEDAAWQNTATRLFGESRSSDALRMYQNALATHESHTDLQAQESTLKGWAQDVESFGLKESLMLASKNSLVKELNDKARNHLVSQGLIDSQQFSVKVASHKTYKSERGLSMWSLLSDQMVDSLKEAVHILDKRPVTEKHISLSVGDRIIITDNDRDLKLLKGMRATVTALSESGATINLDSKHKDPVKGNIFTRMWTSVFGSSRSQASMDKKNMVSFDFKKMNFFDHAYALTIHKSQGQTVEATRVLASKYANAHLSYVSMSRHRKSCNVHYSKESFKNNTFLEKMSSRYRNLSISAFGMRHKIDVEREMDAHKNIKNRAKAVSREVECQKILQLQKERASLAHKDRDAGRS